MSEQEFQASRALTDQLLSEINRVEANLEHKIEEKLKSASIDGNTLVDQLTEQVSRRLEARYGAGNKGSWASGGEPIPGAAGPEPGMAWFRSPWLAVLALVVGLGVGRWWWGGGGDASSRPPPRRSADTVVAADAPPPSQLTPPVPGDTAYESLFNPGSARLAPAINQLLEANPSQSVRSAANTWSLQEKLSDTQRSVLETALVQVALGKRLGRPVDVDGLANWQGCASNTCRALLEYWRTQAEGDSRFPRLSPNPSETDIRAVKRILVYSLLPPEPQQ